MKPTLLVLAAGMGSRYGGLKQLDQVGPSGETIMDYSIFDAIRAGFGKVVFVIRKNIETAFKEALGDKFSHKIEVEYVFQELDNVPEGIQLPAERTKPWGTGHAMLVAVDAVNTPFAVINADDFYGYESYQAMADFLKQQNNESFDYCMVGYELQNTLSEFGHVSRGICQTDEKMLLQGITERTKIQKEDGVISFIDEKEQKHPIEATAIASMNLFGFTPSVFAYAQEMFKKFIEKNSQELKAEFYIPSVANEMIHSGKAKMEVLKTPALWFGVTYKEDKEATMKQIQALVDKKVYPAKLW